MGQIVVWVLVAALVLALVLFALAHVAVVLFVGLGAAGYALWRRKVGG
jgi:hypothetical protein